VPRFNLVERAGSSRPLFRADATEGREDVSTTTLRRQHAAARSRGEFNRDRRSRLLSQAVDDQRRLNARRADDARTVAHPVGPSDPRDTYLTQSHD
jgi:hypothetical protein